MDYRIKEILDRIIAVYQYDENSFGEDDYGLDRDPFLGKDAKDLKEELFEG